MNLPALLGDVRTIAVVGCSDTHTATSYRIARYLIDAGFDVVPVNPNHERVLGRTCYPSVEAIPYETYLDLVCIFRQPRFSAAMVETLLARIEHTDERPVVWTQIGVHSAEAERLARGAGLVYVRNRCIMVEHAARG